MKPLILLFAVLASACGASVLAPSPSEQANIQGAISAIRHSTDVLPFSGQPIGAWFDARVTGVFINEKHPTFTAYRERESGRVFVSPDVALYPLHRLIAILLHEARHADTGAHTCDLKDRTLAEWGPWAVQIWWLDTHGYPQDADTLRADWICH